jgi:hypothetical protein
VFLTFEEAEKAALKNFLEWPGRRTLPVGDLGEVK